MIKRVLVTGNQGYIGSVLAPVLAAAGYDVVGLDSGIFHDATFIERSPGVSVQHYKDVRDVTREDLAGMDAVIHLAALSNDPLGALRPELTYAINHEASVRLAVLARDAGAGRFLFSSSCSMYGAGGSELVDEEAELRPQTPYAESKVRAERDILALKRAGFCPVALRNATVCGISPRMRLDLVVQNLVAFGYLTGVITILSDGTPWRPLIHVRDLAHAFRLFLELPEALIAGRALNVGNPQNNVRVIDIAESVRAVLPETRIEVRNEHPADARSYRVDFARVTNLGFRPQYTIADSVAEIAHAFKQKKLSRADFDSDHYITLKRYQSLLASGALASDLRPTYVLQSV